MPSSNRTQVASVRETILGTTPASPRTRARRTSGEGLKWVPTFVDSEEFRSDRMNAPPIKTGEESNGDIKFELSYPWPDSPASVDIESAFYNAWNNTPAFDNDLVADSVITDAGTTASTFAVAAGGAAVLVGHLLRSTGLANLANNQVFRASASTATTIVGASGLVAEAIPPGLARLKVVGIQGAASDISTTATGLATVALDFTTFPELVPGRWMKIGGAAAVDKFATLGVNDFVRIVSVAAKAIVLDNRPTAWAVDAGTGKTIKLWIGDQIKNGVTQISQTIEKGFLGQVTPTFIKQPGMVVSSFSMDWTAKAKITGDVTFAGMTGASQDTNSLDTLPDATTSLTGFPVMACSANVGRMAENGIQVAAPNFVKALTFSIDNAITPIEAVDSMGAAGLTGHSCKVTGNINTFFGDNTYLTKFFAGTPTSLNIRAAKLGRAVVMTVPQITFNGNGSPNAGGIDQDVMLPLAWKASKDEAITNAMILMDRFEYYEI